MLGHTHGATSDVVAVEIDVLAYTLRRHLLEPIAALGDDVAVILTADHGLADIPEARVTTINDLNSLTGAWRRPYGERRAVGLSLREPGTRLHLRDELGDQAAILDTRDAIEATDFLHRQPITRMYTSGSVTRCCWLVAQRHFRSNRPALIRTPSLRRAMARSRPKKCSCRAGFSFG